MTNVRSVTIRFSGSALANIAHYVKLLDMPAGSNRSPKARSGLVFNFCEIVRSYEVHMISSIFVINHFFTSLNSASSTNIEIKEYNKFIKILLKKNSRKGFHNSNVLTQVLLKIFKNCIS